MTGRAAMGGNGLCECIPSSSNTTTSPFSTSRTYFAPMMSSAQVSEARIGWPSSLPITSGRIARADELLVGKADESVGAFNLPQPLDEPVDEAVALGVRDQVQDDLGVGRRLHDSAVAHQLAAQGKPVGQIAVMADREAAAIKLGEQRLHVAQDGLSGGRIARVAHGRHAGQALDDLEPGEIVADEAQPPLGMEALAVERDDAGGFLPAVLESVQSERGDRSRIRVAEYAEDAALFTQPVVVEIEPGIASSFGHLGHLLIDLASLVNGFCRGSILVGRIGRILGTRRIRWGRRGLIADPVSAHPLPALASSTASRWCFPGRPATSTSANHRFLAARPVTWRYEPNRAGCGQAPATRRTGRR